MDFLVKQIIFLLLCLSISANESLNRPPLDEELLMAIVITRHGDRTPTKGFPNMKSHWPAGFGQLTTLGMKQHYQLGQKFRKKYIHEKMLVDPNYHKDEIHIRSTQKERTLQSAQSFMLGFYPPSNCSQSNEDFEFLPYHLQPVPIHTAEKKKDNILYAYKNCPRIKELKKEFQQSEEYQKKKEESSEILQKIGEILGTEAKLETASTFLNIMNGERIHNKERTYQDEEFIQKVIPLADWVFRHKFATPEVGRLGSGLLMNQIRERILTRKQQDIEKSYATEKFVLYSAHDGTLLALFANLEWLHAKHEESTHPEKLLHIPRYASHLVFEFFKKEENYFIRIEYDNLTIPVDGHVDIPLDIFFQHTDDDINENWELDCGVEPEEWVFQYFQQKMLQDEVSLDQEAQSKDEEAEPKIEAKKKKEKAKKQDEKAEKQDEKAQKKKRKSSEKKRKGPKKKRKRLKNKKRKIVKRKERMNE